MSDEKDIGHSEASASVSYDVGYGKPPKHSQFKPGQSGNPKGRKPGAKSLKSVVTKRASKKVKIRTESGYRKVSTMEAVIEQLAIAAMKGDAKARSEFLRQCVDAGLGEELATTAAAQAERLSEEDAEILARLGSRHSGKGADDG
jgi:hypothetical protein